MPNEFIASASAHQPERLIITEADSLEELHPDGAWIGAAKALPLEDCR